MLVKQRRLATRMSAKQNRASIVKQPFKLKTYRKDGLILQIHHTVPSENGELHFKFIHAAFASSGEKLSAVDYRGNIFIIDLANSKFWLLPNYDACSVVAFSPTKESELLVGTYNCEIKIYNMEQGVLTQTLGGLTAPPRQISFSSNGKYCLTAGGDEAVIWDCLSNVQVHRLSLKRDLAVKQVLFMPVTDNILACFEDDAMNIWKLETLQCIRQILPEAWKSHHISTIAFTRNGRAMVVGGDNRLLVVFDLDTWCVGKVINLPEDIPDIYHAEFIPQPFDGGCNKVLGILSSNGRLHFFDIESSEVIKSFCNPKMDLCKFMCSGNGKYLACILRTGEINIYLTSSLLDTEEYVTKPLSKEEHENEHSLGMKAEQKRDTTQQISPKVMKQKLLSIRKQIEDTLHIDRLRPILKEFGEYPESYRSLIWKTVLQLPHNQEAFTCLVKRGIHPVYKSLEEHYPLENKGSLNSMKRLLSCLAHWSSLFAEVKFLPLFVFPFVRIFQNDPLTCFEVVVTIIVNWCQHWFEFFPFPPISILATIENVLSHEDPDLMIHFFKFGVTTHIYAWPLLETAFSEVLSKHEWLHLWDHIISNKPSFLLMAVVAYNIVCHKALKTCECYEDFEFFFRNQNPLDMRRFISKTYMLCKTVKKDIHPDQNIAEFKPLEKGAYPVYNKYPKCIVDYKAQQIEDIRREEERILKETEMLMSQKISQNKRMKEERATRIKEKRLCDIEAVYEKAVKEEEDHMAQQRAKIALLRKDLHHRELELLATTRSRLMKQNVEERGKALNRMLDEIERKRRIQDAELAAAESEIRHHFAEFKAMKENLELELGLTHNPIIAPSLKHRNMRLQQDCLEQALRKLREETSMAHQNKHIEMATKLMAVDDVIQRVDMAQTQKLAERQLNLENEQDNLKMLHLEEETKSLEEEVKKLVEQLTKKYIQEGSSKLQEITEIQEEERELKMKQENQISKQLTLLRGSSLRLMQDENGEAVSLTERISSSSTSGESAGTNEYLRLQQNAFQKALKVREELLRSQQL